MTAVPKSPRVSELRELFRHLREFRSVYEAAGLEEIQTPYGNTWSLWDLEYLLERGREILTFRQFQAINLCLINNMRERDAAIFMQVSPTNPVMMYASLGLQRLIDAIDSGQLPRFKIDGLESSPIELAERRLQDLHKLAGKIKAEIDLAADDCWAYRRTLPGKPPRILLRSPQSASGLISLHPIYVTYQAYVQTVPKGFLLVHKAGLQHLACVNPDHGVLMRRRF